MCRATVCLHIYSTTVISHDLGESDSLKCRPEAHCLGGAPGEKSGSDETSCKTACQAAETTDVCFYEMPWIVIRKLWLSNSVRSEVYPISQMGGSCPAKQEAVPESWPPGGHWCPGASTSPAAPSSPPCEPAGSASSGTTSCRVCLYSTASFLSCLTVRLILTRNPKFSSQ